MGETLERKQLLSLSTVSTDIPFLAPLLHIHNYSVNMVNFLSVKIETAMPTEYRYLFLQPGVSIRNYV
jgi:hypothetical protein